LSTKLKSHVRRVASGRHPIWKDKQPLLHWLDLELTERCNNDCVHCSVNRPAGDADVRARELSTDAIKTVLSQAAELGCLTVRFTGGEPLLREDFADVYVFARRLGLKVCLFTNATLLMPDLAGLLARIPPLEKVEVSLYGMSRASYEVVTRIPGSYDAARRGIGLLLENKVPFVVKTIIHPANESEFLGFKSWAISILDKDHPPQAVAFFNLRARRDSELKNSSIRELRPSPEKALKILTAESPAYVREMKRQCQRRQEERGKGIFRCGAGQGMATLDAYGILQPCLLLRHPEAVYDLKAGSLRDALSGFFPSLRRRVPQDPRYLERCAECFLSWLCEQCPAKSWVEHGTLDTPVEYWCDLARIQAEYLGLLKKGEEPWGVKDGEMRLRQFIRSVPEPKSP
jgi:radical SAM protein with 4Fe4S-binding SPASM domain